MKNILSKIKNALFSSEKKTKDLPKEPNSYNLNVNIKTEYVQIDLNDLIKSSELKKTPVDRHFLLLTIVEETYKLRKEEKYKNLCIKFSEKHLDEFPSISKELKDEFDGSLPRVPTYQYYATLLTEIGEFEKAISVCQKAITFGLDDGTKGGYEGRIERITKKMLSAK